MSNKHLFGPLGAKAVESKKVQSLVKKNFENTIGGAIIKNNTNKSPSSRPVKSTSPAKPTSPVKPTIPVKPTTASPLRIRGRTGLNINY
jgi:hypothetical protein